MILAKKVRLYPTKEQDDMIPIKDTYILSTN